jgi:hypothetical protein
MFHSSTEPESSLKKSIAWKRTPKYCSLEEERREQYVQEKRWFKGIL